MEIEVDHLAGTGRTVHRVGRVANQRREQNLALERVSLTFIGLYSSTVLLKEWVAIHEVPDTAKSMLKSRRDVLVTTFEVQFACGLYRCTRWDRRI